ncbi:tRNA threonylcarbamoyladenosine dehydratase [Saccharicrinis fermentans]|uniref:Molybdopterin-synthase adenylyltransferase n=1 Tax=Saccharicrinis fermentans DSM 9555 = JCM 21142 TaxID=869213 RepID=W7Y764_9BACT|nr:tRNA threonylcarbamoyladenosine dehydratase [Saccharicrinis fermentans]GAF03523.1 molybdopterin-synthase adenylyltransferase [Saccharicrinis fermentans DSM 9555 = JCM 21142]
MSWLERTELLLGQEKIKELSSKNVLVVGLGGVGGFAAEMIARAGIGKMTIIDGDTVNESNKNRQLPALCSTMGMSKAQVMEARLLDINPALELTSIARFIDEKSFEELLQGGYDYIVDAIDTLSPKVALICAAVQHHIPIISSMGAGGKMDPSKVEISDISNSKYCKLARMVRKRIYKEGIRKGVPVVYSSEMVAKESVVQTEGERNKKTTVGTISYMPAIFGCLLASKLISDLAGR